MRVFVSGGAGYIGSHTVRRLLANGHEVTAYDDLSAGHRQAVPENVMVVGRLQDTERLNQIMAERRIEAVVHFAASVNVGESVADPSAYYANNVGGSLSLLDACKQAGIRRFVFSSTCATYGVPTEVPITENEKQLPINPYGNTKLAIERAAVDYANAYGISCCFFRYFNASGASSDASIGEDHRPETHLIPLLLAAATRQRPPVNIFGTDYPTPDGTCIRDYVHVDDLAAAHELALHRLQDSEVKAFNLGTGCGQSVWQVVRACEQVTRKEVPVRVAPRRVGDPPELVADSLKIYREWGWQPEYRDLKRIVETAWKWHESHPNGYGERGATCESTIQFM